MAEAFKITGLDGAIETLRRLPKEIVSKRGGPILKNLRKAARVITKQEKVLLQASLHHDHDEDSRESTGLLMKSLIVTRGKAPNDGKGERVLARVKRATYPGRSGKPVTTLKAAQLKEYGSSHQQADSFVRAAGIQKQGEVRRVFETGLATDIDKLAQTLIDQNKGR
jgi:hypothetical protein